MTSSPRVVEVVAGHESSADLAAALDALRHGQAVEYVHLSSADLDRSRLRVTSDAGRDYAIALPRGEKLRDGTVLVLDGDRAVIVRAGARRVLRFGATSVPAALRLGFVAGHLHWRSTFDGEALEVLLEGPEQDYLNRVADLIATGDVRCVAVPPS
ncbi:urease accessory protein UreE [Saccharopolyspora sp. K220]|uniref:urease accessory protein UreE n=1 Tax=Saccharopolyspora soli TaxID=2926618 RepID=UPI001F56009C|nr:urease accessory protein UreE [Saccharopolyspora soli]MCI2421681.1 urease accessory protein UreE [Saccharopolyspora soli]